MASERQIDLFSGNSVYSHLKNYLDRTDILSTGFVLTNGVTVTSFNFMLLSSSPAGGSVSGHIAVCNGTGALVDTAQSGGQIIASKLSGSVGTGSATAYCIDSRGLIANLVDIRQAGVHQPILDLATGRKVFGLVQTSSSAVDGVAVAASGSENLQISFVIFSAIDVLTLVTVNSSSQAGYKVEFELKEIYAERYKPQIMAIPTTSEIDVYSADDALKVVRYYTVTHSFVSLEVINIDTGAGSVAGTSTVTDLTGGQMFRFPTSAAQFNADGNVQIIRNGVEQIGGIDVNWVTTASFSFSLPLSVGETFKIILPVMYI